MKRSLWMLTLVGTLTGACGGGVGSPPPSDSGTSVTPSDGGIPTPDTVQPDSPSTPEDAAVGNDVPVTPADNPVVANDPFLCTDTLCATQNVVYYEGGVETNGIRCQPADSSGTVRAQLYQFELADGWTECRGSECSAMMPGRVRRVLRYTVSGGVCSRCADLLDFGPDGLPMTRTSGVRQICRM